MNEKAGTHFERPTMVRQHFPLIRRTFSVLAMTLIGLLTGALGAALILMYVPVTTTVSTTTPYDIFAKPSSAVVIDQPLVSLAEEIKQFTVAIVHHRERGTSAYDLVYDPNEYVTSGYIATSDGWIMTSHALTPSASSYDVFVNGTYVPVTAAYFDPLTQVTFVKIEASDLKPVELSSSLTSQGETVIANVLSRDMLYHFTESKIAQPYYYPIRTKADAIKSSDALGGYGLLVMTNGDVPDGGYFNTQGQMAGLMITIQGEHVLAPSRHVLLSFEQMLRKQKEVDLGIRYTEDNSFDNPSRGILVYHPLQNPIKPNSIAARSQLRALDRLMSINGDVIDSGNTFDYVWRKHEHDSQIRISVIRDTTEGFVDISLP